MWGWIISDVCDLLLSYITSSGMAIFVTVYVKEAHVGVFVHKRKEAFQDIPKRQWPTALPNSQENSVLVDAPHFTTFWCFPHFRGRALQIRFSHINLTSGVMLLSCQESYRVQSSLSTHSQPCSPLFLNDFLILESLWHVISLPGFVFWMPTVYRKLQSPFKESFTSVYINSTIATSS
jgi:hypothetical protein